MMTKASVYCRKSNVQDVADEAKSVTRQEEGALAFITAKGWQLVEVYKDDGVSGALFDDRKAFAKMMRDAEDGQFEALVLFDLDRFGRYAQKAMAALYKLAELGVTVWDYSTDNPVDLETFEGETMAFLKTRFAQQYRDSIRKHTKDALRRKVLDGLVAGGKVFGYDNVRVDKGHTERRINPEEAKVVVEIYERFASKEGLRGIAAALNRRGVPKPRAQQGRKDGWSASTIRAVLSRPLYRGEVVYGKMAKAYGRELPGKRERGYIKKSPETWIRVQADHLRIISPELAARVDAVRKDRKERYFRGLKEKGTRFPERATGKYLLTGGMLVCPMCKGHFEAIKHPWKSGDGLYVCSTRRRKPGVCTNLLELPIQQTDNDVLSVVEGEVLGTRFIRELLELVEEGPEDETSRWETEKDRLRLEIDRMVHSIAAGVPPESVAGVIQEKEQEIKRLEERLRFPRKPKPNIEILRVALEQRAEEWKSQLRDEPKVGRMILRRLIGPIMLHMWPPPEFVKTGELLGLEHLEAEWKAETKPEELLRGLYDYLASPRGLEQLSAFVVRVAA